MFTFGMITLSINFKNRDMKNNQTVLKKIKEGFLVSPSKNHLTLPGNINFIEDNNDVIIDLSEKCVIQNMQEDCAAFEGWSLVLKIIGKYKKVKISWKEPIDLGNGHYQRFLFRVFFFKSDFNWFEILNDNPFQNFKIDLEKIYIVNEPDNRDINYVNELSKIKLKSKLSERDYEIKFICESEKLNVELRKIIDGKIEHQFPVGLFNGEVSDTTKIFTGRKSAIDLWSINDKELSIFELKKDGNIKMGIISELYFYASFIKMIQNGNFYHKNKLSAIKDTNKIKAYFLAPKIHPLITKDIITEINSTLEEKGIVFNYIKINGENLEILIEK